MSKTLLGALEAGGTKMVVATGYADGTVVECEEIPTGDPVKTMEAVADWFRDKGIAALGIGAFGPTAVNPASPRYGQILETPKTAWRYFDLLGSLKSELDVPCGYDTDVNSACLGEATHGCARGLDTAVYLTIGTGVGAGVMIDGELLHGMMHPEAGHILLQLDPRDTIGSESGCPYHPNCLEGLIAGPAIKRRWNNKQADELADDGEAMDLLAGYLAQALVIYTLCYSPQRIIIGGGVADHTPIVSLARKKVVALLNGYIVTPEISDIDTYIVENSLDGKQGILGCLELARRAQQRSVSGR
ncbi:fructokinase [Coriobacterium glomerans PW2]|uniref:fructokinase n=1 Tax=Coriobacterium glomerans (strain ATCC 49209 / DSM 20642 / JCM 10262 / PW2) TaxID=700015 RepID=F2NAY8_CORGP|nr:ROK family protein [Coriobacterium glomerans]AEB07666.1 fructokinase [Coriobacterium glomerans PW2]